MNSHQSPQSVADWHKQINEIMDKSTSDLTKARKGDIISYMAETTDINSIIPNGDVFLDNGFNVMLVGLHGTGKTQSIMDLTEARGINVKYYSCSTLDPYTDLVGVPTPRYFCPVCKTWEKDDTPCAEHGRRIESLRMVRPHEVDEAEMIFFDEFNRADPKTMNAVFEIIQFRSINGDPLPNLRCVWAAINPPEAEYHVEELDPALLDRFDVYVDVQPKPSVAYMSQFIPEPVAKALKLWWDDHDRKKKKAAVGQKSVKDANRIDYVSPRRLMKIGLVWEATHNTRALKQALPIGGQFDTGKLVELLRQASNPGNISVPQNLGDAANGEFTYTREHLLMQKKEVAEFLAANPNAMETHRKVLDTLENGVSGSRLVQAYGSILDSTAPALLEGWFNALPEVKQSHMRTGFKESYSKHRAQVRTWKNLYKVLERNAKPGFLPDITK